MRVTDEKLIAARRYFDAERSDESRRFFFHLVTKLAAHQDSSLDIERCVPAGWFAEERTQDTPIILDDLLKSRFLSADTGIWGSADKGAVEHGTHRYVYLTDAFLDMLDRIESLANSRGNVSNRGI